MTGNVQMYFHFTGILARRAVSNPVLFPKYSKTSLQDNNTGRSLWVDQGSLNLFCLPIDIPAFQVLPGFRKIQSEVNLEMSSAHCLKCLEKCLHVFLGIS